MLSGGERHTRQELVAMLISTFDSADIAKFGPKQDESFYSKKLENVSLETCVKAIKDGIDLSTDELSNLSDIHPAWIVQALEMESPKIIGIILRWLPSRHVNYILEHLPKRVKLSLPKLVESFAIPGPILRLIKNGFERKFKVPSRKLGSKMNFGDVAVLKTDEFEVLFRDLGLHELAMAFQGVESEGLKILLNRMDVTDARALQQRIKDAVSAPNALLKDSKYTILEVAMDQEDIEKLLLELGVAAFSKALNGEDVYSKVSMKLEPKLSYLFKRYLDQHIGANKHILSRQRQVLERVRILSSAALIDSAYAEKILL